MKLVFEKINPFILLPTILIEKEETNTQKTYIGIAWLKFALAVSFIWKKEK